MPTQSPEARQSRHPGPQDLNQQRPSLAWPPQGLTQEAQELSTEKFGDLGNKTFKGQWREGSGPLALSPSQGHSQQAGLAPSFLYTPLCHHGKPQRGPVQSKSAPGRQGLLGVVNSRSEDNGPARGCCMPLALLSWTHRVKAGELGREGENQSRAFTADHRNLSPVKVGSCSGTATQPDTLTSVSLSLPMWEMKQTRVAIS